MDSENGQESTTSSKAESEAENPTTCYCQGDYGPDALHQAAEEGDLDLIVDLLAKGLDTRARDGEGQTPLLVALASRRKAAAELLVDNGKEMQNMQDMRGNTPLHYAAQLGYDSIAAKLLLSGVHAHIKDESGYSPLHYALRAGWEDITQMILAVFVWRYFIIDWKRMKLPKDQLELCMRITNECRAEMERMWDTKCHRWRVVYNIMTLPLDELARHLEKEELRDFKLDDHLREDFPHFADLITCKVRMSKQKRVLTAQGQE